MTEITTDKRIDDLRADMREGFARSDKRVDDVLSAMQQGYARSDQRVDDLRSEMHVSFAQVDQRFDRVEADIRELRSEVRTGNSILRAEMKAGDDGLKEGIAAIDARFGSLQRLMIRFFAGTLGSIIAGVVLLLVAHH